MFAIRPRAPSRMASRALVWALALVLPAAASASPPARVTVTNVTDQSCTIHWFTNKAVTGQIRYGTSAGSLTNLAEDVRGAATSRKAHYVTVSGLVGGTPYFFKVVSAGVDYGNPAAGDAAYSVTTGSALINPPTKFASGVVSQAGGAPLIDEFDDGGAQLSGWSLDGVAAANSLDFTLFWTLKDVGGTRTVRLFKNNVDIADGSADLVASGSVAGNGAIVLNTDNASGITGTVTVAYSVDDAAAANRIVVNDVIVVASIKDNNASESSGTSLPRSVLAQSSGGRWFFQDTDFRTSDGSANFIFHASADQLLLAFDAGPLGTAASTEPSSRFQAAVPFDILKNLALPAAPTVTAVAPASGDRSGATSVTLTGTDFLFSTAARLDDAGSTALTNVVATAETTITATVPAGLAPGSYNVIVTNPGGSNVTSTQRFSVTQGIPTVATVNPAMGDNDLATPVVLTGTNFTGTTAVRLSDTAGTALTGVVVNSDTQITATVPAGVVPNGATGYDVLVTNTGGTNPNSAQRFVPSEGAPTVTNIVPAQAPNNVATAVTVTGTNFLGVRTTGNVRVNGALLTGIVVTSDTSLTATVPTGIVPGLYDLIVTNTAGANGASVPKFTVTEPLPTVTAVVPASGLNTGTTGITVTGTGFLGATLVQLGTAPRTNLVFAVTNATQLTATVPAGLLPGSYRVIVTNSAGESAQNTNFLVTEPLPGVTSVAPANGINTVTTDVTITGSNYLGATAASIKLGTAAAVALTNFVNPRNGTSLTARVPAGLEPGAYDVIVTNTAGSNTLSAQKFTVTEALPTVAAVAPTRGPNNVVTPVTITGTGFLGADNAGGRVELATAPRTALTGVSVVSNTQINASVPTGLALGTYAVLVTNTAGTNAAGVTFQVVEPLATITTVTPNTGVNNAPTNVTIDGQNFASATGAVLSDAASTALANFVVAGATRITATVPAGVARGAYDILITNGGGTPAAGATRFTVTAPPVADAGANQAGNPGLYILDGSRSLDPDGGAITYAWTAEPGNPAAVTLQAPSAAKTSLTAVTPGAYTFRLTVTDPTGATGTATTQVTIADAPPVADPGPDATVSIGVALMLDGRGSSDANGTALTYAWTESAANPSQGVLSGANTSTPTFLANIAGVYTVILQVTSGGATSPLGLMRVQVLSATVVPPNADAGIDQLVFIPAPGSPATVQLSGRDSVDPDNPLATLVYTWTEDAANPSLGRLSSASVENPTFTATVAGTYRFNLVVRDAADDNLVSAPATVTVSVDPIANPQPTAVPSVTFTDANANGRLDTGEAVALSGAASVDAGGGGALTYTWTQVEGPNYNLSGAALQSADFTALTSGTYVFQLVVSDGTTSSAPQEVRLQILPAAAPLTVGPPAASAKANAQAALLRIKHLPGDPAIALDGSASVDNDGDAQPLRFRWEQEKGPTVALTGADTATASFNPLVSRVYVFRLRVTDSNGLTDESEVSVVVDTYDAALNPTGNDVPTAVIAVTGAVDVGAPVTLDGSTSSDPADGDLATDATGLIFFWDQTGGPIVNLDRTDPLRPTFTPPLAGTYTFTLYVDDGADLSPPATVTITTGTFVGGGGPATKHLGGTCWAAPSERSESRGAAPLALPALAAAALVLCATLRRRHREAGLRATGR